MKNKSIRSALLVLSLFLLSASVSEAQTPQYCNSTAIQNPNAFPFNTTMGKRVQMLYIPGEFYLPSPAPAGNISSLSFLMALALGPYTYSDLTIRMGRTNITDFTAGNWYEGQLDTVYHRTSVQLSAKAGQWLTILLDRTFAYDPAQSLVVEIKQCGAPGAGGFSFATSVVIGNRRHVSSPGESCPLPYGSTSGVIHSIGFTYGTVSGTGNNPGEVTDSYGLFQNYPNPFNPSTTISYNLPKPGYAVLNVFNVLGKQVASLASGYRQEGSHTVVLNAADLPSGVYFYELQTEEFRERKKMTLIK